MIKHLKAFGFSLVEVLIVAGLLSGLGLFLMQIFKNSSDVQKSTQVKADELDLRNDIGLILRDIKHCRISLAGDGTSMTPNNPVKFYKDEHDDPSNVSNGLDVELFLADQAGNLRTQKKFSKSSPANTYGLLTIKSMKLYFLNGSGFNYTPSLHHQDMAEIQINVEKKVRNTSREFKLNFNVNLDLITGSSNETTIIGCSNNSPSTNIALSGCYNVNSPANHSYNLNCNADDLMVAQDLRNDWLSDSEWNKHQYVKSIKCCKARAGANLLVLKNCVWKDAVPMHIQQMTCDPNMVPTGFSLKNDWLSDSEWNKHQYVKAIQCCELSL